MGKIHIEVKELYHIYKAEIETIALANVNFSVKRGERVWIKGKSGTGKTTLLHNIASILRPTAGKIIVNGENIVEFDISKITDYRKYAIGLIYQSYNLLDFLTISENIELPMRLARKDKNSRKIKIEKLSNELEIERYLNTYPSRLSGGEQQRVAIAVAIANEPQIILADEPTGNLDEVTSLRVYELLKQVSVDRGATLIIVSHDNMVAEYTDRVLELGKIQSSSLN